MKALETQIRAHVKGLGLFRVNGNTFSLLREGLCLQFVLKKSRFNVAQFSVFHFEVCGHLLEGPPPRRLTPKALHAAGQLLFIARSGDFWPGTPLQFQVTGPADHPLVLAQVQAFFAQHVQPFCTQMTGQEALIAHLVALEEQSSRNRYSMGIAMALAKQGRAAASRPFFATAEGDPAIVRRIAEELGVVLD